MTTTNRGRRAGTARLVGRVGALALLCTLTGCEAGLSRRYSSRVLNPYRAYVALPSDLGLAYETLRFTNERGRTLRGWFLPSKKSRAAVLLFGGNTGNMSYHLLYAQLLHRAGLNVLLFEYQGFGRSGGRADLRSLAGDGLAALAALKKRAEVDPKRIALFGVSLGSILALAVAAESPGIRAVVAVAPYEPERAMARALLPNKKKRWRARIMSRLAAGLAFPWFFKPHEQLERIPGVPVFFIHGEDDRLLPPTASLRLFLRAAGPKQLWLIEGSGHSPELLVAQDGEYQAQVVGFLRHWLAARRRPGGSGFDWRVTSYRDGTMTLRLRLGGAKGAKPIPGEVITIPRGGARFERFRVWLRPGEWMLLRPQEQPVAVAFTPRLTGVRRQWLSWAPTETRYARSYRLLKEARPRLVAAVRGGLPGLARARKLLDRLHDEKLDPRIAPRLGRWYALLGRRLERAGQLPGAVDALTRSLELAPTRPGRYYELGDARFSHGPPRYLRWARALLERLRRRLPPP
ncbi:MAG: alpha/beta fold hydrolase [bacterium]